MVKIFILICFICVAAISAYDFKDSAFNEVILRDLLDLTDDSDQSLIHRISRAAESIVDEAAGGDECKWKKRDRGARCCNDKVDFKHLDIIKAAKKQCMMELHGNDSDMYFKFDPFTCEKLEELKNDVTCIAECVGKKFNVLDEQGNIRRDMFVAHLKMRFAESDWKLKVAESIVDKCLEEARKEIAGHVVKREVTSMKQCNPTSLKISQCMWREYVRACPKDLKIISPKCNKLREKIEKGDAVTYKGFYLRHLNEDK